MNKKEIKLKVVELLTAGTSKNEIFAKLSGQGIKDSLLAHFIASYADKNLCIEHERKVNILITLMFFQAFLSFFPGLAVGASLGLGAKWIVAGLFALIPLLFALGFYRNNAGTYNAYILLTIVGLPQALPKLSATPIAAAMGLLITIGILCYVYYVRSKIFPDYLFISPKKIKNQYVFSS